jgi:hypothetical protein
MSDTIQSAEDYSEAFINAVEHAIVTGTTASLIKGSIDIATLIKVRDAAIRADEARKQADRYAACVEAARAVNHMLQPNYRTYYDDEAEQRIRLDLDGDEFGIPLAALNDSLVALADLEAPK